MNKDEILSLTCKKHIKIYLLTSLGLSKKEVAIALNTNVGHVFNVLKEYTLKPEKAIAAHELCA